MLFDLVRNQTWNLLTRCIWTKLLNLNWSFGGVAVDDGTNMNIKPSHQRLLSPTAVLPVLHRCCHAASDRDTFRKQSCMNASEEQEMKERSPWNAPRGRHPGGEAASVALR